LPQKEDTLLGDYDQKVSGGQRQRISIARELFKDIEILIMDEATSALDSETELIVQNSIDQLKCRYTVIVIAHRLSTVKSADKIYLLNQGRIQSSGAFDELLSSSPKFAQMVALQEF
jgi:ABC-type multidrug transport system fused ATPase/permease subunit